MENSYRFFENRECKYFPCHKGLEDFNCLFCYCPLYYQENCPGNPKFIEKEGKIIKACTDCTFPHRPENYDVVVKMLLRPSMRGEGNVRLPDRIGDEHIGGENKEGILLKNRQKKW